MYDIFFLHDSLQVMVEVYLRVDLTRKMILKQMLYMKLLIREWMADAKNAGKKLASRALAVLGGKVNGVQLEIRPAIFCNTPTVVCLSKPIRMQGENSE
jgi:hypothetical protein